MGTVFVDGIQVAQNRSSAWWGFYPGQVSFGAYNEMAEASNSQVAEFMMILSSIEDSERHLVEGYLAHKWGIALPSEHPWAFDRPTLGEIVTERSTPDARTTQTLAPIVINRIPANQTDTSASLTGQLVSAGKGLVSNAPFSPSDDSGLRLWLDASDADGDGVDGSALVNGNQVSLFVDKSGQGNDAEQTIAQSQPTFIGSGLNAKPLIRFDGSDDYLQFNEINNLRTVFMVVEQQTGNNGFLLGHEDSFAFHSGAGTAWSDTWTDAYVLNGILQVNGNMVVLDEMNE